MRAVAAPTISAARAKSELIFMLCRVFGTALLLTCLDLEARAEGPPWREPVRTAAPSPNKHVPSRIKTRGKAVAAGASKAAAYDVVPPSQSEPPLSIDGSSSRKGNTDLDAWSVKPKWSAVNGGSSAAYGTRALMNELQSNPSETTGYGAGAQLDYHF